MAYLLDTNVASHVIKGDVAHVRERLRQVPIGEVAISVVTEAEFRHGLAKRGHPEGLARRVHGFLIRVDVLPWTSGAALAYGSLRAGNRAACRWHRST
jgi:tRNA(fMet)-specific endonuclease VapC